MERKKTGPLKIAMIGHKRVPGGEGGVEVVVEELAVRMAAKGHQVTLYNRAGGQGPRLRDYKGCRIITVPTLNKKSLDALIYSFLAAVRSLFGGYDLWHFHALGPSVMLLLPHLLGKRTVATVHGRDWQRAKWGGLGTRYLQLGERVIARYADEVIVLSRGVQEYFWETYGRKTTLIPNGVNLPRPLPPRLIQEEYGLEKGRYILFLARIVPEKGLHYLLDAFEKLDTNATYFNMITSTVLGVGKIPMVMEDDKLAIQTALKTLTDVDHQRVRMVYLKNTLSLQTIMISEALREEAEAIKEVEIVEGPRPLRFDGGGALLDFA